MFFGLKRSFSNEEITIIAKGVAKGVAEWRENQDKGINQ